MARIAGIKPRRGTTAEWAAANAASPSRKLDAGELGYDSTTKDLVVGDGTTAFASLPRVGSGTYARLDAMPLGADVVAIGDSITASAGTSGSFFQGWLPHLAVRSLGRIRCAGIFAAGGYKIADAASVLVPQVISMSPRPDAAIVMIGANDCSENAGAGFDLSAKTALFESGIIAPLQAAGIQVSLSLVTPSDGASGGTSVPIKGNISRLNEWIRTRCRRSGFPCLDAYAPLVDTADGSLLTAYRNLGTDRVHPNYAGYAALAEWNIASGFDQHWPPVDQGLSAWGEGAPYNCMQTGTASQMMADTNADGISDGWATGGGLTGTFSRVDPIAADRLVGKWQQVSRGTGSSSGGWLNGALGAGTWSIGDVLEYRTRVQTSNLSGSGMSFSTYMKNASSTETWGLNAWTEDIPDGLVTARFTVPASSTGSMFVYLQSFTGTPTKTVLTRVGQVTVKNLTTGGTYLL